MTVCIAAICHDGGKPRIVLCGRIRDWMQVGLAPVMEIVKSGACRLMASGSNAVGTLEQC